MILSIGPIRRRLGLVIADSAPARLVAFVMAFVVVGCFLPSRYQYQHFFALIPQFVVGSALAIRSLDADRRGRIALPVLLATLAITSFLKASYNPETEDKVAFFGFRHLVSPNEWFHARAARFGAEIRAHVPAGRVLTLAPTWPLAGGVRIYPEFATGPFAWRSAEFVDPSRRARLHVVAPADLESFLAAKPPAAILTGVESPGLEAPLISYAETHGFQMTKLSRKRDLWISPAIKAGKNP